MTFFTAVKSLQIFFFGSPGRDRLTGAIASAWVELDQQLQRGGSAQLTEPWARAAYRHLLEADRCVSRGDTHNGWHFLLSAQRAIVSNPHDSDGIYRTAVMLRREASKITGWRAKAIDDLICNSEGKLRDGLQKDQITPAMRDRVVSALALRDDQFHNNYYKILLRRRSLFQLFLALWLGVAMCLVLSFAGLLSAPFNDKRQVAVVVLLGVLGACLSVSQGLLTADTTAKIPAQEIGAFVVWMRPAVGAVAALIALILLYANHRLKVFGPITFHPAVVMVFAFVAGYSERFIVGAIEQIGQTQPKK